ncbi:MAG TPA: S26 family signal peptidase, partial [Rubricoccaceae bacterium]
VVPGRGLTVPLNRATWPVYAEVIARYEGHTAGVGASGEFLVDIAATPGAARALDARPEVAAVVPFVLPEGAPQPMVYPQGSGWNADQYGPVVVPGRGLTVPLNRATWPVYAEVIARYEGHTAGVGASGEFLVDGHPATEYTFAQDYYFAMGDSRDNSVDSRFWGFVPESHVVGKAVFKFLSFKGSFPFVRLERFFRPIP